MKPTDAAENPILNSPFREPGRHWQLSEEGALTQVISPGRRRSEYFVPIAPTKKKTDQVEFELDEKDEAGRAFTPNDLVNEIRGHVERWRRLPAAQWGVSHETARLLDHWRSGGPRPQPFFCQIEAAETLIWLEEVAPKHKQFQAIRRKLIEENEGSNPGLFRIASKMATGSGKTTVMAMLIAWQTVNAARGRTSFSDAFLIICPGITIRDRLRVLLPSDPGNYYETNAIVPDDMIPDLRKARVVITNYHALKHRETLNIPKFARQVLGGRGKEPTTTETYGQMLARVCPELLARKNVIVINDEAHHCYEERPGAPEETKIEVDEKQEVEENQKAARLWINGIKALHKKVGVRTVYDLSATPFFLRGSGHPEGTLFPWVVSDFALMDAIECGIVKIPRVPVSDNSLGYKMPVWRKLWPEIRGDMPKKGAKKAAALDPEKLPEKLLGAIHALYEHYEKVYDQWRLKFSDAGLDIPPVFIVVCQNTSHSKLVYDYISGYERIETTPHGDERQVVVPGRLTLFNNYDADKKLRPRPRTLLIDSNELDSGEGLSAEFKRLASGEIDAFKTELAQRFGQGAAENVSDEDLLREVMNTVGKPGKLGESIRCVVSVSMLTEGWDANTVTHILGVRAFGTELLCEQVVGRGLRRVSYDADDDGMFAPEYANVFGIPFAFAERREGPATFIPPKPTRHVFAVKERADKLEIRYPRVQGYRVRLPDDRLTWKWDKDSRFTLSPDITPTRASVESVLGEGEMITLDNFMDQRASTVAFHVAGHALRSRFRDEDGNLKPFLFPRLLKITREWFDTQLQCIGGTKPGLFLWRGLADEAALRIYNACVRSGSSDADEASSQAPLFPIIDPYNPEGSSRHIDFRTSKELIWRTREDLCHVNYVVGDSDWELTFCETLEAMSDVVLAYVKNHGLHFEVPYAVAGGERRYRPDFIIRLDDGHGSNNPLNLVVEIKGFRNIDAQNKKEAMETHWIPAVNQHGGYGRWAFREIRDVYTSAEQIRALIQSVAKAA